MALLFENALSEHQELIPVSPMILTTPVRRDGLPFVHLQRHMLSSGNGVYNTQGAGLGSWHEYGLKS